MDDLGRPGSCGKVLPCLGCKGIQIAYYSIQVVLGLVSIRRDISGWAKLGGPHKKSAIAIIFTDVQETVCAAICCDFQGC